MKATLPPINKELELEVQSKSYRRCIVQQVGLSLWKKKKKELQTFLIFFKQNWTVSGSASANREAQLLQTEIK